MKRRSSEGWSGAFLVIATLGFLGPACVVVVGSETIMSEPLGEGGSAGSGGGGGSGGTGGGGGGTGGGGGALCCEGAQAVTFTKAETQYFEVTELKGIGSVAPDATTGCLKADGPEKIYAVTYSPGAGVAPNAFLTASLKRSSATFDSVLYAKKDCCVGPTETCSDSTDSGAGALFGGEVISIPVTAGDTWYIFVDGADADDQGNFEIVLNVSYGWSCQSNEYFVPIPLELGGTMTLKGTTDIANETNGCGGVGPDWIGWGSSVVYALSFPPSVKGVDINLKSTDVLASNDTLFYIRPACLTQGTWETPYLNEIACVDNDGVTGETYSLSLSGKDSPVFLFADVGKGQGGPFDLTLTPK